MEEPRNRRFTQHHEQAERGDGDSGVELCLVHDGRPRTRQVGLAEGVARRSSRATGTRAFGPGRVAETDRIIQNPRFSGPNGLQISGTVTGRAKSHVRRPTSRCLAG